MTTKPTTDELLAKLAALDVEILYFGDDREVQGAWLEEDMWHGYGDWPGSEEEDVRPATDAEIIRALAAALFGAATDAAANKAHTTLGHAVAKVLPGAMAFDPRTAGEAQSWRMVRNEVTRLDQVARPGLTMGDDDIMPIVLRVLRVLRRAAREPIPGPHEPDEDGVAECPNCTQSLTRGIRHLRKEDGTLSGMSREGLYCSECDDDWEPVPVVADPDEVPF